MLAVSTRDTSKRLLEAELARQKVALPAAAPPRPLAVQKVAAPKTAYSTITRYAWDQSKKFVKIYVTLPGLDAVTDEAVTFHVEPTLLRLEVMGLAPPASNSRLLVPKLFGAIVVDQSTCTRKPENMLLLKLRKAGAHLCPASSVRGWLLERGHSPRRRAVPREQWGDGSSGGAPREELGTGTGTGTRRAWRVAVPLLYAATRPVPMGPRARISTLLSTPTLGACR